VDSNLEATLAAVDAQHARLVELLAGHGDAALSAQAAQLGQALAAARQELELLAARAEHLAMTDLLTGLPNRRYALSRLGAAWAAALRHKRALGCLVVDADGFRKVNDAWGHAAGDAVLVALAQTLRCAVREGDEVCRLGGDEFLVLCPETGLDGTVKLGERLREAVAGLNVEVPGGAWAAGVSAGAAARQDGMADPDDLLRAADAALAEARRQGGNRVAAPPAPPVAA
jgi:diguanylate cyclase (GGDEF)-like protein